jgi:hypothetical protein
LKQSHVTFIKTSYFPLNNIVFPLFEILFGHITPEMFRNNNFVNKDGQKISFGRIHQNVGLVE